MGKSIEQKYSDVNHRIIKKSVKNEKKSNKSSKDSVVTKRKLPSIEDNDQPSVKLVRKEKVNVQEKPRIVDLSQIIIQNQNEINSAQVYAKYSCGAVRLEIRDSNTRDLFLHDERTDSYENYVNYDFGFHIVDEIGLEGLDGITLEAFWKRLAVSLQGFHNLRDDLKESIWMLLCKKKNLQFFKLPEPRGVLDIYDRLNYLDGEIGVVVELAYELPDIYPFELVNNPEVQGSCSTFNTRTEVSMDVRNLDLKAAEQQFGTSLVVVGDQKLRKKAIFCESADPIADIVNMEYCTLERIGRSRKHGELTQGNMSIGSHFKMDSKSVHHYMKQLVRRGHIARQFFYIKSIIDDQNKTGRLLHLRRFYHKIKPKQLLLAEQIINVLKERPDCRIEFSELRRMFSDFAQPMAKVIKSQEFRKYIRSELICYRDMYPNADKTEYMRKAKPIEKFIKCLELRNPYINIIASWCAEQEDSDDDNEDGEEESTGGRIYNMECFKEVYFHILSKGREGCTAHEIQKLMGVDSNTMRMCMKKLVANDAVAIKKFDQGRQRHLLYFAKCWESEDVVVTVTPQPSKLSSNVLEKLKSRQRAAIEKSNQTPAGKTVASTKTPNFNWNFKITVPKLSCPFFIRNLPSIVNIRSDTKLNKELISMGRKLFIKLDTHFAKTNWIFEINNILGEINSDIIAKEFKTDINPVSIVISKNDTNYITKLILLRAAFGDFVINATTLNCFTRKRQFVNVPILSDIDKERSKMNNKLQYMGSDPVIVFSEKEDDISVEILVSSPPPAFKDDVDYPHSNDLSERVISRIRIILRVIYEKRIFEEVYKLIKVIEEEEFKGGYEKKIDRKSLARILRRLVDEGYIKIYKLTISNEKLTKIQTFICHPCVAHTDSMILSACQQLKWKYFVGVQKKNIKTNQQAIQKDLEEKIQKATSPFNQTDVMTSIMELKELNKLRTMEVTHRPSRLAGKTYGFKPKFIRMRIIHEFLHYLIYAYDRNTPALTDTEVKSLFEGYRINVTKDDLKQIPNVYCSDINWKMFIPPLPHHGGWMAGWALMCDVILRLPISVLCKIHNVSYDVPELSEILNHPIKRFYLVKDLPENVRRAVLAKRKYLFNIHDSMCRLAWCGLLQFGPQKYKEKDQVFIFLNRMASLYDTISSEPAYNKITNKEYRKLAFYFNGQEDVDSYWYNAYGICLSTKLNSKQSGQLVTIFDPHSRPELTKALKSKTPEEALRDDNGEIPGDRRGASGFDSSLWSHIMKNWFWAVNVKNAGNRPLPGLGLRREKLEKILPRNISYSELHTIGQLNKIYLHKNKEKEPKMMLRKYVHIPLKPSKSVQKITRRIPFRPKFAKRQYNDAIDKVILKRIGVNVRVKWNREEDRLVLLCLAAGIFLNPRFPKKQWVPYSVMRDVLHILSPESRNKTSRAVQRRMKNYLARRHQYIEDNVLNLFELKPISEYYGCLVNNLAKETTAQSGKYTEAQISTAFVILMSYLVKHQEEVESILQGNLMNVDYLTEGRLDNTENNVVPMDEAVVKYEDAKNEDDIKRDVLKSVIHSSLSCKNKPGWTFQLFKIYQKYTDNLICEALSELKRSQAISFNKFVTKKKKNRWHTPFQLSNLYIMSQSSTFNITTAVEAYKTFLNLKENKKFLDFSQEALDSKKYGQLVGLNEFCSFWDTVRFKFHLPRTMVILNPHIKDHSELIDELATRWQARLKRVYQDNAETDLEQDSENGDRSKSRDCDASTSKEDGSVSEMDNLGQKHTLSINDNQNNPLDLTVDDGNSETIDRLKTWVTDCMEAERERRSPSPEFMQFDREEPAEPATTHKEVEMEQYENYDDVDKVNMYNVKKALTKEQIPTLEEIKEGMVKYTLPSEERRLIPYITDLCDLLTRENTDLNMDEEKIERLQNHFITQYAVLEDIILDNSKELQDFWMVEYVQSTLKNKELWERVKRKLVIKKPTGMLAAYRILEEKKGKQADLNLANQIVEFLFEKKSLGATGPQLKEEFKGFERTCSLETILQTLVDERILLRAGICTVTFVHYLHQSPWLVETFKLSKDEQKSLEEKASTQSNVKENIDKQLEEKSLINISVMPWIKVDGSLNEETLKVWLCNVLSHCLNCPRIMFPKLCEKFCYVKPVDIYFILEVLQELGCVELFVYEKKEQDINLSWEHVKERNATFLDNFENMCILPNNVSLMCLGSFLHEE